MHNNTGIVLSNRRVGSDAHLISIQALGIAKDANPGQFVHVKCGLDKSYILRRPLSINRVQNGVIDLFFSVKGKGTLWLSQRKKRDEIDLLGPLGSKFSLPKKGQTVMVVAGGMGIAPMMFLADVLVKKQCKVVFAYGAKCKDELHFYIDVKRISHRMICSTEDGSYGALGVIVDTLPEVVKGEKVSMVYACGPKPMMAAMAEFCTQHDIPGEVALEERMACGIGACLSCVCKVRTNEGEQFQRVCKEGPVFDISKVVWS